MFANIVKQSLNVFSWKVTGFHKQGKRFELNFFLKKEKRSSRRSIQEGKIDFTASQFGWCVVPDDVLLSGLGY